MKHISDVLKPIEKRLNQSYLKFQKHKQFQSKKGKTFNQIK